MVEVVQVVATCTTVSGEATVVYYYGYFGNGGGEKDDSDIHLSAPIPVSTSACILLSRLSQIQWQVRATIHRQWFMRMIKLEPQTNSS